MNAKAPSPFTGDQGNPPHLLLDFGTSGVCRGEYCSRGLRSPRTLPMTSSEQLDRAVAAVHAREQRDITAHISKRV